MTNPPCSLACDEKWRETATFLYRLRIFAAPSPKAVTQADIAQLVEQRIRNA